jgi:hypothetical protein
MRPALTLAALLALLPAGAYGAPHAPHAAPPEQRFRRALALALRAEHAAAAAEFAGLSAAYPDAAEPRLMLAASLAGSADYRGAAAALASLLEKNTARGP